MQHQVIINQPNWTIQFLKNNSYKFQTLQQKMKFVLDICRQNIINKTGGPFSAAIFNKKTNQLISYGVNVVVPQTASIAHAQMMAIMLAQKNLHTHDLSAKGQFLMVTSSKMCTMCMGAVIWSGLCEVASSSTQGDVQQITGFDQGPSYNNELSKRGINCIDQVMREEGRAVLKLYIEKGGKIYNSSINKLSQVKQ